MEFVSPLGSVFNMLTETQLDLKENGSGDLKLDETITLKDRCCSTVRELLEDKHPHGKPAQAEVLVPGDFQEITSDSRH